MTPQKFLTELKAFDQVKYSIVMQLRALIIEANKSVSEEIKYGGLYYSASKPYTGLFVSKNHVSMEFSFGAQFSDPKGLLQGKGKGRRHLKLTSPSDIDEKAVKLFLKQALKISQ